MDSGTAITLRALLMGFSDEGDERLVLLLTFGGLPSQ
jgi:hypothetical protein